MSKSDGQGSGAKGVTDPQPPSVGSVEIAPTAPLVQLRVVGEDVVLPLDLRDAWTLGAGLDVDLHLARLYVSRQHAALRRLRSGAIEVSNLSQNGTRFEGQRNEEFQIRAADTFGVGASTLLALDEPMVRLRAFLARCLGFEAHREVDKALVLAMRHVHAPLVLTGPKGGEPDVMALAIHRATPRRGLPFVIVDALAPRGEIERSLATAREGSVFCDLRPLKGKSAAAALVKGLLGPEMRARVIVAAWSGGQMRTALASDTTRLDEINTPPVQTRLIEVPALLDAYLAEAGCARRITELPSDRLAALSRFSWPDNLEDIRNAAVRLAAYLEAGRNLTTAANVLGVKRPSLTEALGRIGAIPKRGDTGP